MYTFAHSTNTLTDNYVYFIIVIFFCPFQYVQYKHHIPDLKEFTLCGWHKLYNHSSDHPIFSYSCEYITIAVHTLYTTLFIFHSKQDLHPYVLRTEFRFKYLVVFLVRLSFWRGRVPSFLASRAYFLHLKNEFFEILIRNSTNRKCAKHQRHTFVK